MDFCIFSLLLTRLVCCLSPDVGPDLVVVEHPGGAERLLRLEKHTFHTLHSFFCPATADLNLELYVSLQLMVVKRRRILDQLQGEIIDCTLIKAP